MDLGSAREMCEILGGTLYPWLETIDWPRIETDLGVQLPADYKYIVSRYSGMFISGLAVVSPRWSDEDPSSWKSFVERTNETRDLFYEYLESDEDLLDDFKRTSPPGFDFRKENFRFYPDVPGLLCWGTDWDGAEYFWRVDSDPESWKIVVWQTKMSIWVQYDMSMSEYIMKCIKGELDCLAVTPAMRDRFHFEESPHNRPDGISVN